MNHKPGDLPRFLIKSFRRESLSIQIMSQLLLVFLCVSSAFLKGTAFLISDGQHLNKNNWRKDMNKRTVFSLSLILFLGVTYSANAMHIAEGFLSPIWCVVYFILSAPFFILGVRDIKKKTIKNKDLKMLLALVAAYAFVLSAMKLPSVTGSSSHPTGTGLGAIIFGPFVMSVVGSIVLLFQALFLAHGGLTTLGANTFSMGIVGPIISYLIYKLLKNKNKRVAVFLAAALGDLITYVVTSMQLGLAFPSGSGGVMASFIKFLSIFAITQIPLAIVEGLLTVGIFEFVEKHSKEELEALSEVK